MATERVRRQATAGDMVRSLAVVLAVVAVILLLNARDESATVREVGIAGPLTDARASASYDVLAPVGLDDGWKPTSVRAPREDGGVVWHVGYVTPEGEYAGLDQATRSTRRFVDRFAEGSRGAGEVRIGERTWQRREGGRPEPRALVLTTDEATTVVSGTAAWAELEELARSLRSG